MKIKRLPKELRIPKKNCTRCGLSTTRTNVCHGTGPGLKGGLVFVGEGPGHEEDISGLTFCGRAGVHINGVLKMFKIPRNHVNFLNILKCRPLGNRDPRISEVEECILFLNRQIEIIEPKLVVALGRVACAYLTGFTDSVIRCHGNLYPWLHNTNVDVMYTFHPAFVIRPNGHKYKNSFIKDIGNALRFAGLR